MTDQDRSRSAETARPSGPSNWSEVRHLRGRHKIAITNHCRLATETINPAFGAFGPAGAYSTVLTVNSGYE